MEIVSLDGNNLDYNNWRLLEDIFKHISWKFLWKSNTFIAIKTILVYLVLKI